MTNRYLVTANEMVSLNQLVSSISRVNKGIAQQKPVHLYDFIGAISQFFYK